MSIDRAFYSVVADLLNQLGRDGLKETRIQQEVYSVTLKNKLEINLIGRQNGYVNLLCFAGRLPVHVKQEALLALLQANLFTPVVPPIMIGVDAANGSVVLWTRLGLPEATSESVLALFLRMAEMGGEVSDWLRNGSPAKSVVSSKKTPVHEKIMHR